MDEGGDELFAVRLRRCQQALVQGQETLGDIAQSIDKELAIGSGQCARLVNRLRVAEEPVQTLLSSWSAPEQLPLSVRSTRHALLVLLYYVAKLRADLNGQISVLADFYRTCSAQQAHWQRQQLLSQLDSLKQCYQQIADEIGHLLLADAKSMEQP